jgi:TonB family protein
VQRLAHILGTASIAAATAWLASACTTPAPAPDAAQAATSSKPPGLRCTHTTVHSEAAPQGNVLYEKIRDELVYPQESCLAGREGTVVARFVLLRNGEIERAWVHKSSGDPLMDREVLHAFEVLRNCHTHIAWPASTPDAPKIVGELTVPFRLVD